MYSMLHSISGARGPKRILSAVFIKTLVLAAFVGGAVTAMPQKGAKSDGEIHDQVLIKLAGDQDVKGTGIEVAVKDGVVTLEGKVKTEKVKAKAERLAKKVRGVKSVVNKLAVGPR